MANDIVLAGDMKSFSDLLTKRKPFIQQIAASHIDIDRLVKIGIKCVTMNPALARCSQMSVFRALVQCAELGLEPGNVTGEAYLIPYGNECTLIPGYRGLVNLARRSGQISTIYAYCVYEGDQFSAPLGTNPEIKHDPNWGGERDPLKITHVYAVCKFKDGSLQFDVMTRKDVDAIRKRSKASGSGPWVTDYAEMAKKTVLRRLCKLLPMSIELQKASALDNHNEFGDALEVDFDAFTAVPGMEPPQIEQEKPTRGVEAVKSKLDIDVPADEPSRLGHAQ